MPIDININGFFFLYFYIYLYNRMDKTIHTTPQR